MNKWSCVCPQAGNRWRGTVSKMIVANRFFKSMAPPKPPPARRCPMNKVTALVNPEAPVFYTKQSIVQMINIVMQTYKVGYTLHYILV